MTFQVKNFTDTLFEHAETTVIKIVKKRNFVFVAHRKVHLEHREVQIYYIYFLSKIRNWTTVYVLEQ